jgi:hypothetical protein
VTNGTAAGTSELSVSGAYSGGSIASQGAYFTVIGNDAIFMGVNTNDQPTVGVTNGTAAGSSELAVANAYSGGLFDWSTTANPEFTALGNEVLFEGEDQSGHLGLWVTNGTVLGTSELTGIANAYSGGLFTSGVNPDLTANGNVALIDGYDANGQSAALGDQRDGGGNQRGRGGRRRFERPEPHRFCFSADLEPGVAR